tara:strand:+ start:54 stop:830 length:777 start_codon:yes stop_codon:yes gene_type:complete
MAKLTLLEMVQDIMSDMDSDDVNSINDSVEGLQVAQIIKTTYYNIIDGKDYAFLYELFQMNTGGTIARPSHMALPDDVIDLKWIKYNCKQTDPARDLFQLVEYKAPEDFMYIVDGRDSTSSDVVKVIDSTGISINVLKNKAPQYFTSFDDVTLVFDSYLATIESTLQNSKTQCWGKRSIAFTLEDTFIPDLPIQMFTYLLNEAKSAAFLTLKQMANQKAEQISTTQRRRMSQDAWKIEKGITYPNYGRNKATKRTPNY